ncbi:MAG: heat-inducible transcription repressor HrcA [Lachnospiraceae bacterium]|nr:heat-inducible transcription repressor HrcA [Lachnospiraceae bacterium]
MELDERKVKILQAVIRNYLETGEPVGSRTVSKYTDLNLSSATIRNEMADLEEMGYILQPHTSAGRIPSDKGYRLYVDTMMEEKEREVDEKMELVLEKTDRLEQVLKQAVKLLASNTQYAAMVTGPNYHRNKLKFIQLSRIDAEQILTVIVVEGNIIKNKVISVSSELSDEDILKLNILLNSSLGGMSLDDINLGMITMLKEKAGIHSDLIAGVVDAVADAIRQDEDLEIYTSGANNIFRYPELADNQKASEIINMFEEKQPLSEFVKESVSEGSENGIQIYIGSEAPVGTMRDCSVVTATYQLDEGLQGTIGIIGPKRMDYDRVVGTLKNLMEQLDSLYKKK